MWRNLKQDNKLSRTYRTSFTEKEEWNPRNKGLLAHRLPKINPYGTLLSTVGALHDGVDAMPEVLSEPAAHQPSDRPTEEEEGAEDVPLTEEELRRSLQLPDERVTAVEVNSKSIAMAIRQYWHVYHHIPENPGSMVAALQGDNEQKLVFIEWEESNLSDEGFLDPWGRPYDVSIVSNVIVVISGGANRVMGDDDDVVKSVNVPRISPHEE